MPDADECGLSKAKKYSRGNVSAGFRYNVVLLIQAPEWISPFARLVGRKPIKCCRENNPAILLGSLAEKDVRSGFRRFSRDGMKSQCYSGMFEFQEIQG